MSGLVMFYRADTHLGWWQAGSHRGWMLNSWTQNHRAAVPATKAVRLDWALEDIGPDDYVYHGRSR